MSDVEVESTSTTDSGQADQSEGAAEVTGRHVGQSRGRAPQVRRPARGLIGWMATDAAVMFLNGNVVGTPATPEQLTAVEHARQSVATRAPFVGQGDVVADVPEALGEHFEQLGRDAEAAAMLSQGWVVRLVDLTRVCGFQPTVFSDSSAERVSGLDGSDVVAVARVTLPVGPPEEITPSFDPGRNCWLLSSRNPNLRVVCNFAGSVATPQGALPGFGFVVTVSKSFMQVGEFEGRYFMRDGNHRAMGLIGADIHRVPAFVKQVASIEELVPANMLPQAAYRGSRPPYLPDYLDDAVAASSTLPAVQKLIAVQALELSPLG